MCPGELNTFISFNRTRFTIIRGLKGNVLTSHYLPEVSDCNESSLLCSVTFPVPRSGDIDYVVNISLTDQQYNKSQMICKSAAIAIILPFKGDDTLSSLSLKCLSVYTRYIILYKQSSLQVKCACISVFLFRGEY